jgi:hypothetical protein
LYTIRQATETFAKLDGTPEDQKASLDKALRNISTRVYLAPKGREGVANLYDLSGICALRLIYKATVFGLDRWMLEDFARWLQNQPVGPARRVAVDGGLRSQTPIEEGIDRAKEDQRFDFNVILYTDGRLQHCADWADDDQKSAAVAERIFALAEQGGGRDAKSNQDARFVLPASRHLADLIAALGA